MNAQEQNLLNLTSEEVRLLTLRVDTLVEDMNKFRDEAMRMLTNMASSHKPKGQQ